MSKELEKIKKMYEYFVKNYRDLEPKLMICEKEDFDIIEKELKALEIIKNKRVDVNDLLLFVNRKAYNDYVVACDDNKLRVLTKKEYDLLKEVLL